MRTLRIRWTGLAKVAGGVAGVAVAVVALPGLLRAPAAPPLERDVGLPRAAKPPWAAFLSHTERKAAQELQQHAHEAGRRPEPAHAPEAGRRREPGRRDRRRLPGDESRPGPGPDAAPEPVPAPPPAPEPGPELKPAPAPEPTPAPPPPPPVDDGSVEFAPH